jgi:hypothetical protein
VRLSVFSVNSQEAALRHLAELAQRNVLHPLVRETAVRIVESCHDRDDDCELEAIFNAVKSGMEGIPGLENGVKYMADPRWADQFTAPSRLIEQCKRGVCAGDCDDMAGLIVALAGSLGYSVGLRVWGKTKKSFTHVYAVAGLPKRSPRKVVGLDATVPESHVGWEPPGGEVLTAWLE